MPKFEAALDNIAIFQALNDAELLTLARASGVKDNASTIVPTLTHADIARRIGSSRETVSREINALAKSGIVKKDKRVLTIQNVAWLAHSVAMELRELLTEDSTAS